MAWKKVRQSPFLPRAKDSPAEKAKRAMGTYNVFFESPSWPDSGHFKTDTQAASLIEFSTLVSSVGMMRLIPFTILMFSVSMGKS